MTVFPASIPPPLPPRPSNLRSVRSSPRPKYKCSCGPDSAASFSSLRDVPGAYYPCSYYGRCVEPVAWSIEHEPILTQASSPLYSVLPQELRDLVFIYALTDTQAHSFHSIVHRNAGRFGMRIVGTRRNDIATNLLCTCRAIYYETWMLPLSLNPFIIYNLKEFSEAPKPSLPYPWQLALVQSLDIAIEQHQLEAKSAQFAISLEGHLHGTTSWHPEARHQGVYAAPCDYRISTKNHAGTYVSETESQLTDASDTFKRAFEHQCYIPSEEGQERHFLSHALGRHASESRLPWSSAMRVARAMPLVHLTLRIQSQHWWTWTDPPSSTNPAHHLALDPALGDRSVAMRPTAALMNELATRRRAGITPPNLPGGRWNALQGWGPTIGRLPDLKCLELVLETFTEKRAQLEQVVEAAKTWRFPIAGGAKFELVWDGHVEYTGWSMSKSQGVEKPGDPWHKKSTAFDVRTIRFRRVRTA